MEETSGPRESERADWVGNPDGEYVSKGPGEKIGAGRKEKYRAWKLGGARAYTMAVNACESEHEGAKREERCGRGKAREVGMCGDGQGGFETRKPREEDEMDVVGLPL
jgi:hypothetical protein